MRRTLTAIKVKLREIEELVASLEEQQDDDIVNCQCYYKGKTNMIDCEGIGFKRVYMLGKTASPKNRLVRDGCAKWLIDANLAKWVAS